MNGKDLLESMGYVDEKYIQQAAAPQRCRSRPHWRSLAAAAACLAIMILGIRALLPAQQENFAMMQKSTAAQDTVMSRSAMPETAVVENAIAATEADNGIAPLSEDLAPVPGATPEEASSGTAEMVVRVLRQEADALVCVVTDPGTGSYAQDCEIRIALPDAGIALADNTSGARLQTSGPAAGTGAAAPAAVSAETTQAATAEETIRETEEAPAANEALYFRVTYLPEDGSLIHPLSMTALDDGD